MSGIGVVAAVEVRQRLRAGRWQILLGIWFLVLALVTLGLRAAAGRDGDPTPIGAVMFGGLSLFVLVAALLVVPALSSQSVNGDRERGVLATLQVTDLTPWEITLGKFAAAWGVALVFLAGSLPLDVWALAEGGVGIGRFLVVTLIQTLLLGVVVSTSLGLSALLARTTTSAVLSYLAVLGLTVGTLIAFGLASTVVQRHEPPPDDGDTYTATSEIWWILAPNPVVVMVDASPSTTDGPDDEYTGDYVQEPLAVTTSAPAIDQSERDQNDPLRSLRREVRQLRVNDDDSDLENEPVRTGGPVWPWGPWLRPPACGRCARPHGPAAAHTGAQPPAGHARRLIAISPRVESGLGAGRQLASIRRGPIR